MKHLGGFLALVIFSVVLLAPGASAAEIKVYNNQLKVTGVVLPAQHIVVDEQGIIQEILSNTDQDIMPKVYVGSIAKENLRAVTPEIYKQYRALVPKGSSHVGTLYKRTGSLTPLKTLHGDRLPSYALPF